MPLTFKPEDFKRMTELQEQLSIVLRRANDNHLEAAIAAFACVRCARTLLELYPVETRVALVEQVVVPFLQGEPFDELGLLH